MGKRKALIRQRITLMNDNAAEPTIVWLALIGDFEGYCDGDARPLGIFSTKRKARDAIVRSGHSGQVVKYEIDVPSA